jgi:hypothetical protein
MRFCSILVPLMAASIAVAVAEPEPQLDSLVSVVTSGAVSVFSAATSDVASVATSLASGAESVATSVATIVSFSLSLAPIPSTSLLSIELISLAGYIWRRRCRFNRYLGSWRRTLHDHIWRRWCRINNYIRSWRSLVYGHIRRRRCRFYNCIGRVERRFCSKQRGNICRCSTICWWCELRGCVIRCWVGCCCFVVNKRM